MTKISDNFHYKKLKEKNIDIKTSYIVDGKILSKSTDNSVNDDIKNGVLYEKEYFLNGKPIHKETEFDTRIEYTFIDGIGDEDFECPNCGHTSKMSEVGEGCPYCHTYYNVDYKDKDLGSKNHYDSVLRSNTYKVVTLIVDVIISMIIAFIFIKATSRTFNINDIYKALIGGVVLSVLLYYVFYLADGYIVLGPIKSYKAKMNNKMKEFWNRTKYDQKKFFNNFNYELNKYYYSKDNIIDYDIIDYVSYKDRMSGGNQLIDAVIDVRIITLDGGKIKSTIKRDNITLKKCDNQITTSSDGINVIKCSNCGASIDVTSESCEYCKTKNNYLQEWVMIK